MPSTHEEAARLYLDAVNNIHRRREEDSSVTYPYPEDIEITLPNNYRTGEDVSSTTATAQHEARNYFSNLTSSLYYNRRHRLSFLPEEVITSLKEIKQKLDNATQIDFITLAGGAPRDLYMKYTEGRSKGVKDYDIFVKSNLLSALSILRDLGFYDIIRVDDEDYENNEENPDRFKAIYEAEYDGLNINIIVVDDNNPTSQSVIDNFACSMSKFELDIETMEIIAHKEALLSIASETLIFKDGVRETYEEKVCGYFPEYTVGSYQQAVFKFLDKELGAMTCTIDIG